MPRKSTSAEADDPVTSSSPQTQTQAQAQLESQWQSQPASLPPTTQTATPQAPTVQATEQQLKARAEGVSIEDYLLPRSLTLRLAKSVLPPNTSIQKDAVLAIQKAATVFVSYLSSHANEATLKRTVAPTDVLGAITELEFDSFRERLEKELEAFTEAKAGKRGKKGDSASATPAAGTASAGAAGSGEAGAAAGGKSVNGAGGADVRGTKRVKRGVEGTRVEEDGDETQDEPEGEGVVDENETEDMDEEEDEDEEEEEEDGRPEREDEDIDRVEDLDREAGAKRVMDPDAVGDESDSEDEAGPGSQLRGDLGMG